MDCTRKIFLVIWCMYSWDRGYIQVRCKWLSGWVKAMGVYKRSMQINKTWELSLKCDCTLQCNSSDVGNVMALLDWWIFNTKRSVQLLFRASHCVSCEFRCQWMKCVGLTHSAFPFSPIPNPNTKTDGLYALKTWQT